MTADGEEPEPFEEEEELSEESDHLEYQHEDPLPPIQGKLVRWKVCMCIMCRAVCVLDRGSQLAGVAGGRIYHPFHSLVPRPRQPGSSSAIGRSSCSLWG